MYEDNTANVCVCKLLDAKRSI